MLNKIKNESETIITSREQALSLAETASMATKEDLGVVAVHAIANEGEPYNQIVAAPTSLDPMRVSGIVPKGEIQIKVTKKVDTKAERAAQAEADRRNPFM